MRLLEGQHAIVTGAASARGLGKATAKLFSEHGATVAILDLDEEASRQAAADIGTGHLGLACDVTSLENCRSAAAACLDSWGRIDILVNNAGITSPLRVMEIEPDDYDAVMDANLRGTIHMTQAVVPAMREQRHGRIVNLSSVSAQRGGGIFGGSHYSASKAAILGFTKASARELAPDGIRVNAICPGFIDTDITAGKVTDEMKRQLIESTPMGRVGVAEDVAGCALFLASELSSYCTGTEVDVNGGSLIH